MSEPSDLRPALLRIMYHSARARVSAGSDGLPGISGETASGSGVPRVAAYLREHYGRTPSGPAALARGAQVTPRTARNWLDGSAVPQFSAIVELMISAPNFEALMVELVRERRAALAVGPAPAFACKPGGAGE